MNIIKKPISRNFEEQPGRVIKFITVHHTGMSNHNVPIVNVIYNWFSNPQAEASAHFFIDASGIIYELVAPELKAWHCGTKHQYKRDLPLRSVWGWGNENNSSVGIELAGQGDVQPYTDAQYNSLIELVYYLINKYSIVFDRLHVVAHSELSSLKQDPADFDWNRLIEGVNTLSEPIDHLKKQIEDKDKQIKQLQEQIAALNGVNWGYKQQVDNEVQRHKDLFTEIINIREQLRTLLIKLDGIQY